MASVVQAAARTVAGILAVALEIAIVIDVALDGDQPVMTDLEVQARHHPAVRLLIATLQNDARSPADDAAEDPHITNTPDTDTKQES